MVDSQTSFSLKEKLPIRDGIYMHDSTLEAFIVWWSQNFLKEGKLLNNLYAAQPLSPEKSSSLWTEAGGEKKADYSVLNSKDTVHYFMFFLPTQEKRHSKANDR